jgi:ATP-dependent DNA helicase RecQ
MQGDLASRALQLLRQAVDPAATFREGQLEAILAIVRDRDRVLVVQRTGWGKSAVYFIATRLLRDEGSGPTLLISPLLALMRNQIEMARRLGVRADTINSANTADWDRVAVELREGGLDLLLVSPERLYNPWFRTKVLPAIAETPGLLVVDEAHCISDWGHDFRPDYRRLRRVVELLPRGVPVLCTTATANNRVVDDIGEQLGRQMRVLRGNLDRESLRLAVLDLPSQAERLAWLARAIPKLKGSGIVYTLTVPDTERVAGWLRMQGVNARAYSGETSRERRVQIEEDLLANRVKVVVATSALGMGFDKPDLGFVIHYQSPGSPIAYYQQVGRAGRALDRAPAILLRGSEDRDIQDYFIKTAFPPRSQAEAVVSLLQNVGAPLDLDEILGRVNIRRSRLEAMLRVLEAEGAVERVNDRWRRTLAPWSYPEERVRRVTQVRRDEQQAMERYADTDGCLMEFLRKQLDDAEAGPCGRCMNCTGQVPGIELDLPLVQAAREYLRSGARVIKPREVWASGLDSPAGRIGRNLRLEEGRALAVYNDDEWGGLVRRGKFEDGAFSDELVGAAARLIRERWRPDPFPCWVTCVPSTSRPGLVPDFAKRLAAALDLPFLEVVERVRQVRPQKEMENSAQQLQNVFGAFRVAATPLPGPVLLVDDIVDSRWTLTVVGVALREAGSGPVYPFVLAEAVSV